MPTDKQKKLKTAIERKLSDKQLAFALEYFQTFNASESAVKAGYSKRAARVTGHRLLTNANIENYLTILKKEAESKSMITVERLVQELARLAFADISEAFTDDGKLKKISEMNEDVRRAIVSYQMSTNRTVVKFANKKDAIETIMKYLGAFEKDNDQKRDKIFDLKDVPTDKLRQLIKYLK